MNLIIVFVLSAIAIFVSCRVIDLIIAHFNFTFNQDRSDSSNTQYLELPSNFDLGTYHHSTQMTNNCNLEVICGEVTENAEGISESLNSIAESVGEHLATVIEG